MFTFFGGAFLHSLPSSLQNYHLLKLGVAEAPVAVGVEPGEDLLDLLLRQVLGELWGVNQSIFGSNLKQLSFMSDLVQTIKSNRSSLFHLRLGDVAVLVLVVQLERQLRLLRLLRLPPARAPRLRLVAGGCGAVDRILLLHLKVERDSRISCAYPLPPLAFP